jgi:hypothetical protein
MAFSKTPEADTHSVKRVPTVGSPFLVPRVDADIPQSLNFYNCFPYVEKQLGGPPKFAIAKREPYISALSGTTGANVSTSFSNWTLSANDDDNIFFARDNKYYYAQYSGSGSVTITEIGTFTSAYLTAVASGMSSVPARRIIAVHGTTVNTWLEDGSGFTTTTGGTVAVSAFVPSAGLVYLNGYLFAVANNRRIYNSTAGGVFTTWASTDFIDAEIYPDITLYIAKHHNYLVAFGENSTEFFYDGANEVGSPLSRQESYSTRIGCHIVENTYKATCNINDDIYFIGKSPDDTLFLAVVKDFKVKPIDSQLLDAVLNSPTDTRIYSIETWTVNNLPMVLIKLSSTGGELTGIVYNPEADSWWTIDLTDIGGTVTTAAGDLTIGNQVFNRTWSSLTARYPFFLTCGTSTRNSATINVKYPDKDWGTSNTAYIWTDVIDMDVSRWKHIYKVTTVGDYGDNVLTLSYCNNRTYNTWTTLTPTYTQSTIGPENDITWTNLGQFREFSLRMQITGADGMAHLGYEISYNLKMQ